MKKKNQSLDSHNPVLDDILLKMDKSQITTLMSKFAPTIVIAQEVKTDTKDNGFDPVVGEGPTLNVMQSLEDDLSKLDF